MKSGVCPKCRARDVWVAPFIHSHQNYFPVSLWSLFPPRLTHYACLTCGYTESYINDLASVRDHLVAKMTPVEPTVEDQGLRKDAVPDTDIRANAPGREQPRPR